MPIAPKLPTPNYLPGTVQSILAGCSCAMAPLPLSLVSAIANTPVTVSASGLTASTFLDCWKNIDPPGVLGANLLGWGEVNNRVFEEGTEHLNTPQGPYYPSTNTDTLSYWGDFIIESLTHTLATNLINFTVTGYNASVYGPRGIASSNYATQFGSFLTLETGDFIYIRGVSVPAYNRRYQVYRTGSTTTSGGYWAATYTAFHDSTTQLATCGVASGFSTGRQLMTILSGGGSMPLSTQVSSQTMVGSILDATYLITPIKSTAKDRIYPVSNLLLSQLIDAYTTDVESFSKKTLNTSIATNPRRVTSTFNPVSLLESRIDVNCPMHGYQALG